MPVPMVWTVLLVVCSADRLHVLCGRAIYIYIYMLAVPFTHKAQPGHSICVPWSYTAVAVQVYGNKHC